MNKINNFSDFLNYPPETNLFCVSNGKIKNYIVVARVTFKNELVLMVPFNSETVFCVNEHTFNKSDWYDKFDFNKLVTCQISQQLKIIQETSKMYYKESLPRLKTNLFIVRIDSITKSLVFNDPFYNKKLSLLSNILLYPDEYQEIIEPLKDWIKEVNLITSNHYCDDTELISVRGLDQPEYNVEYLDSKDGSIIEV